MTSRRLSPADHYTIRTSKGRCSPCLVLPDLLTLDRRNSRRAPIPSCHIYASGSRSSGLPKPHCGVACSASPFFPPLRTSLVGAPLKLEASSVRVDPTHRAGGVSRLLSVLQNLAEDHFKSIDYHAPIEFLLSASPVVGAHSFLQFG
jgi:hypothetical protein